MGLEHAQKSASAASGQGHDTESSHDQGLIHTAQVAKERTARTKPTADALSAEAMNDSLLLIAIGLHGALQKSMAALRGDAVQVSIYNTNLEDESAALDTAQQRYDHEDGNTPASKSKVHKLEREIDQHHDTIKNTKDEKGTFISGIRDRVFEPLVAAHLQELQIVAVKAQAYGWSTAQHARTSSGVNQILGMVSQIKDVGGKLELASSPSLQGVQKAVSEIISNMSITTADVDEHDLDRLDPYALTQKSVADNLAAAEAQAKSAHGEVQKWIHNAKDMSFTHIVGSVSAITFHLEDATRLLGELKPADRKHFQAMFHGVAKEVEAVVQIGKMKNGHATAGSESMEIEVFPHLLDELRKALS